VTCSPTDAWTAQQLREATPFGEAPRFLIRDNDSKYGEKFTRVAVSSGIELLPTPYRAPKANAFCERFLGSVRRECLDYVLILGERHLHQVIKEFVRYYNCARPHQGIGQRIPEAVRSPVQEGLPTAGGADRVDTAETTTRINSLPVLGGLHHDYRRDRRERAVA
jgi:putative transposase